MAITGFTALHFSFFLNNKPPFRQLATSLAGHQLQRLWMNNAG